MEIRGKKRGWTCCFFLCMLCLLFVNPLNSHAEETEEATIYGLDSQDLEKVTIPENLLQSYQILFGRGEEVTYRILEGRSAKVSEEGLVTPKYTYWKRYSGFSQSVPEGEAYDYYTLEVGETTIQAAAGGRTCTVTVHVEDYAITYGDQVMNEYLAENVTEGMTDLEIMQAIARFPASYDYSASYSSEYSMILNGGGDCWASTGAIINLCGKLGIAAWERDGRNDPGAGGGHMNAMAELNGVYYELEAGYGSPKGEDGYRPYDVVVRQSLFSYYQTIDGELIIYQYDGNVKTGNLVIPESIDGKTVTKLNKSVFAGSDFSGIQLPDTLTTIGDFAFSGCEKLTAIEIPASVTSIGSSVFVSCTSLTDISVAEGSQSYKIEDQVLYTKDGSTLVTAPMAAQVTIPDTVTQIADYAFYYNPNIREITIPASVVSFGEGAFGDCSKLSRVTFEGDGLTSIGNHCFRSDRQLSFIRIPASVETIGAYAFSSCFQLKNIYFYGDAPEFGGTIDGTFYDNVFSSCQINAYYPQGNATWTEEVRTDHGGTVAWSAWAGANALPIANAVISMAQSSFPYTGEKITPEITVSLDGETLTKDEDYVVDFQDNTNAGTASVIIRGIGAYDGEATQGFTIEKIKREVSAYVRNTRILEKQMTQISYISLRGEYSYASDNPSVAAVDENGDITGISAGEAVITITVAESENYLETSTTLTVTVAHDLEHLIMDSSAPVKDGKRTAVCPACSGEIEVTVPTKFVVYWALNESDGYSTYYDTYVKKGDILRTIITDMSYAQLGQMEILSQDSKIAVITASQSVNFVGEGTVNIIVRPKYNPSIGRVYTFQATGAGEAKPTPDSKPTPGTKPSPGKKPSTGKQPSGSENDPKKPGRQVYDRKTGLTVRIPADGSRKVSVTKLAGNVPTSSLTIPDTLTIDGTVYTITSIEKAAFKKNKKLTKVTIGNKIQAIGDEAFYGCSKLKTVKIGKNVKSIGRKAFSGCKKLKNLDIRTKRLTLKSVGSKAFQGIASKPRIKVPKKKRKAYKTLLKKKGVKKTARFKNI